MQRHFKSSLAARVFTHLLAWACVLTVLGAVAGCGQKGPLSLPSATTAASVPAR